MLLSREAVCSGCLGVASTLLVIEQAGLNLFRWRFRAPGPPFPVFWCALFVLWGELEIPSQTTDTLCRREHTIMARHSSSALRPTERNPAVLLPSARLFPNVENPRMKFPRGRNRAGATIRVRPLCRWATGDTKTIIKLFPPRYAQRTHALSKPLGFRRQQDDCRSDRPFLCT